MPRPPRVHVPGGHYHVILRGNHRRDIFHAPGDRDRWERILAEGLTDHGVAIHVYCWMTNHVHMVLQVGATPLGQMMQQVASRYARWFQRRISTTGHLFERRHAAIHVTQDPYLLALVRYIHRNPIRAGLVTDVADHPWSSHRHYIGLAEKPWLSTHLVFGLLSDDPAHARRAYRSFMAEVTESPMDEEIAQLRPSADTDSKERHAQSPDAATLHDLATRIAKDHDLLLDDLCSPSRIRCIARVRAIVARQALCSGVATLSEVAALFGRSTAAMSQAVASLRQMHPHLLNGSTPDK